MGSRKPARVGTIIAALMMVVSGCVLAPFGDQPPGPAKPSFLPATPPPTEMLEPLDSILILRAYSGKFTRHEERTLLAQPEVVVFDDGTVVANVALVSDPPEFRSIQLTEEELSTVIGSLEEANLEPMAAGAMAEGELCFDCATTVIRVDIHGETIEIAAEGLQTGDERWTEALPYSAGLIAVARLLDDLERRVRDQAAGLYLGPLPQIPVAPLELG